MARGQLPPPLTWNILGQTVESLELGPSKGEIVLLFESGDRLTINEGLALANFELRGEVLTRLEGNEQVRPDLG